MNPELTPEEWQYISILIAQDLRTDEADGMTVLVDMHRPIWEKIQPYCQWDAESDEWS